MEQFHQGITPIRGATIHAIAMHEPEIGPPPVKYKSICGATVLMIDGGYFNPSDIGQRNHVHPRCIHLVNKRREQEKR